MRIVGGKYRGRIITPPPSFKARPTTDFAKENLFNVLSNIIDIEEKNVLDLFAGTGAIGYEFASRGAVKVTSVEADFRSGRFIASVIEKLGMDNMSVVKTNAFIFLKRVKGSWDIIFADPPYALDGIETLPELVFGQEALAEGGLFILEHSKEYNFGSHPRFSEERVYGSVHFSFFR